MASSAITTPHPQCPADGSASTRPRKRKRPRVPDEQRQRSSVACASCRRLKEKCSGELPCARCLRVGRACEKVSLGEATATGSREILREHQVKDERTAYLESIAKHFLGDVPLTKDYLARVVQNLQSSNVRGTDQPPSGDDDAVTLDEERFTVKPLSRNVAHYSGEFSHWSFSQRVRRQADQHLQSQAHERNQASTSILEYWRASELKSRSSRLQDITGALPPKEVALFLVRTYFRYAQTNTFFVEESWIVSKLESLFTGSTDLTADDSPWLCTAISVLAVATQYVDMTAEEGSAQNSNEMDLSKRAADAVGVSLYRLAVDLVPDIIAIASVESVQAFLLLAHFTLPLDTQGLSYSYLGLALRMAIQNVMHRRYPGNDLDASAVAFRNRLWWTVYRSEKRVSILHGRPTSIATSEIDADLPEETIFTHKHIRLENTMTRITEWLGDFALVIHMLRKCPSRLRHAYFERSLLIRSRYLEWWRQMQAPALTTDLSRSTAHLHMAHHVNIIFLGRPFMFGRSETSVDTEETPDEIDDGPRSKNISTKRSELVNDAVASAKHIVQACQLLHGGVGLAKSSYMEFSSCRAAVLVLLAQSLRFTSRSLREAVKDGIRCINYMASANQSTRSEASVIAAIESQVNELDRSRSHRRGSGAQHDSNSLTTFNNWAARLYDDAAGNTSGQMHTPMSTALPANLELQDAFDVFGWSPFDLSMTDESPTQSENVATHHFEDAFSISNLAQLNGDSSIV